jgi:hypothetical protein
MALHDGLVSEKVTDQVGKSPMPAPARSVRRRGGGTKPKVQAVGACLRKRVMLCYGALNRAPFDPDWASKKAP